MRLPPLRPDETDIKIVSDGTHFGTYVIDVASGKKIRNVAKVEYLLDAEDNSRITPRVRLTLIHPNVDLPATVQPDQIIWEKPDVPSSDQSEPTPDRQPGE